MSASQDNDHDNHIISTYLAASSLLDSLVDFWDNHDQKYRDSVIDEIISVLELTKKEIGDV